MPDAPHNDSALKSYALKIVDSLYHLSFYSIVAYSVIVFMLFIIGMAVATRVVEVPEFHPK